MAPRIVLSCVLALALAGCGDEPGSAAPDGGGFAQLVVTVDPDGKDPGPAKEVRLSCSSPRESAACAEADRLRPADLAPADPAKACTEQFGGPETARVRGRLNGRAVDARFARNNGCEIARWDKVAGLLAAAG